MDESRLVGELAAWSAQPDPAAFPYLPVVGEYHRVGKHFVAEQLLKHLDIARSAVPLAAADGPSLHRFLDVLLDKRDGVYDYQTYLALSLLPMPATVGSPLATDDDAAQQRRHDRLLVQLVVDTLGFELATLDGRTELFPQLRPEPEVRVKRCRLGLRSLGPALKRLGLDQHGFQAGARTVRVDDPLAAARRVHAAVLDDASPEEQRVLDLSVLPVWTYHDEYLFIRVLQSFETVFALLAVRLQAAVAALASGRPDLAVRRIGAAEAGIEESFLLFSLLATMQIGSFQEFRQYTEGASAIQSRHYKLVESLCRIPDADRLDSPAFRSVPELRTRVLAGIANLDDTVWEACRDGALSPAERADVLGALRGFAAKLQQWRQTHYRLAVRMLGDRPGTGYTEGTPYLKEVRTIPVFQKAAELG
jgi:tryptophan 2,3-dioxygenase